MKYFKSIKGTDFDKAINEFVEKDSKWVLIAKWISERLDEPNLDNIYVHSQNLGVLVGELENPDNIKLFKKDGFLKSNSKAANDLKKEFLEKINEYGLSNFKALRHIFFAYGLSRMEHESQQRYGDLENVIYISSNASWTKEGRPFLEEITEKEYHQKYIEVLEKKEETK